MRKSDRKKVLFFLLSFTNLTSFFFFFKVVIVCVSMRILYIFQGVEIYIYSKYIKGDLGFSVALF